jgi:hypothetical protein
MSKVQFALPTPVWALDESQMTALRQERDELRQFVEQEAANGRDMRPASMNARARLSDGSDSSSWRSKPVAVPCPVRA